MQNKLQGNCPWYSTFFSFFLSSFFHHPHTSFSECWASEYSSYREFILCVCVSFASALFIFFHASFHYAFFYVSTVNILPFFHKFSNNYTFRGSTSACEMEMGKGKREWKKCDSFYFLIISWALASLWRNS